jgi:hypothetical protein
VKLIHLISCSAVSLDTVQLTAPCGISKTHSPWLRPDYRRLREPVSGIARGGRGQRPDLLYELSTSYSRHHCSHKYIAATQQCYYVPRLERYTHTSLQTFPHAVYLTTQDLGPRIYQSDFLQHRRRDIKRTVTSLDSRRHREGQNECAFTHAN